MNLKGRDFLTLLDYTPEEIAYLVDLAADSSVNEQMQQEIDERLRAGDIWYCDEYDQISPATLF